jgi:hypothetical protein
MTDGVVEVQTDTSLTSSGRTRRRLFYRGRTLLHEKHAPCDAALRSQQPGKFEVYFMRNVCLIICI